MTSIPAISIQRLNPQKDADLPLPRYMTPHSAGMDLYAALEKPRTIAKGAIAVIPTGLAMALPPGYEAQIRPRSGLAVKHGIGLINSPGTIDADYRGEIRIAVINLGPEPYAISRGDRIAQMIVQRVCQVQLKVVETLDTTQRGPGGFGHTGK